MSHILNRDLWETLKAVSSVIRGHETMDDATIERLATQAKMLGESFGLSPNDVEGLEYATLLHDIGQVRVRETILKKPGRLTRNEFLEVQAHPIESEKIISKMPHLERTAQWVRWHHEWWDGSGYPDRISHRKIPLPVRILVVVDSFNAMQSERPYRPAMSRDEALTEIKLMSGIQFDPVVVKAVQTLCDESKI